MSPSIGRLAQPLGVIPKPSGFPDQLANAREIADYIEQLSPDGIDVEFVEEFFWGCHAHLVFRSLDSLLPGDEDHNIQDASKEREYAKLPMGTCPPLVVMDDEIQDGHHRYRVAKGVGAEGVWCYVVLGGE